MSQTPPQKSPFPFKVLIALSGRGSNFMALHKALATGEICAVVSNKKDAAGLEYARAHQIPTFVFDRFDYASRKDQQKAIFDQIQEIKPDLVVLAGFMQVLPEFFVKEWYGKLINIHPSILPAFTGLDTHARAIKAKVRTHGCTVHFVDQGVDTGPIIAQAECAVSPQDTETSLADKVLELEHKIYPFVVDQFAKGGIELVDREVSYSEGFFEGLLDTGFFIPKTF
jgi:phosphoribosylglycinamide formyltransferase 1